MKKLTTYFLMLLVAIVAIILFRDIEKDSLIEMDATVVNVEECNDLFHRSEDLVRVICSAPDNFWQKDGHAYYFYVDHQDLTVGQNIVIYVNDHDRQGCGDDTVDDYRLR